MRQYNLNSTVSSIVLQRICLVWSHSYYAFISIFPLRTFFHSRGWMRTKIFLWFSNDLLKIQGSVISIPRPVLKIGRYIKYLPVERNQETEREASVKGRGKKIFKVWYLKPPPWWTSIILKQHFKPLPWIISINIGEPFLGPLPQWMGTLLGGVVEVKPLFWR